jgi:2-polyprenyl-6-methoxyphenol hydroxylase-like FAD-dependent oxidoreductase
MSGAGIAGSCLAFWLAKTRLDISITIIEQSPSPRVTGQLVDIRGSAIEIIKKMKLEEAVRSRGTIEEGTTFLNSSGKTFAQFDAGDSFTAEYEILRADLAGLFWKPRRAWAMFSTHTGVPLNRSNKQIKISM